MIRIVHLHILGFVFLPHRLIWIVEIYLIDVLPSYLPTHIILIVMVMVSDVKVSNKRSRSNR